MSKDKFHNERERVLIDNIRSQEATFYNRQTELNDIPTSRQQLPTRCEGSRLIPRTKNQLRKA